MKKTVLLFILILLLFPSFVHATVADATYKSVQTCNSSVTAFPFTFGIGATSEIKVTKTVSATGVETVFTETTDYTVACTNSDCSSGGTVNTVATCATGSTITLEMNVPYTQTSDYTEGMPTLYETFEDNVDKLTRITQQLRGKQDEHTTSIAALGTPSASTGVYYYLLSNYSTITAAISAIGATNAVLLCDSSITMVDDPTIPSNIDFVGVGACQINKNGHTLSGLKYAQPEWFYGATDDVKIQAALASSNNVYLQSGITYTVVAGLTVSTAGQWLGSKDGHAIIAASTDIDVITVSERAFLENIYISQTDATPTKANFKFTDGFKYGSVKNCWSVGGKYSYQLLSSNATGIAYNNFEGNKAWTADTYSVFIDTSVEGAWVNENNFYYNTFSNYGTLVAITNSGSSVRIPNNNKFVGNSLETGLISKFAVIDYGWDSFINNRVETAGPGFYFNNSTAALIMRSQCIDNYIDVDVNPTVVVEAGRVHTDTYWERKLTGGYVLGWGYTATTVNGESAAAQKVLNVAATTTFHIGMPVIINAGGDREEWGSVDTIQAGTSITMKYDLQYTHTIAQADAVQGYGKPYGLLSYTDDQHTSELMVEGVSVAKITSTADTDWNMSIDIASGKVLKVAGTQVVGAQQTGVAAMTNVSAPGNLDANTVNVGELADIVGTLIVKLRAHGLVAD